METYIIHNSMSELTSVLTSKHSIAYSPKYIKNLVPYYKHRRPKGVGHRISVVQLCRWMMLSSSQYQVP